MVDPTARTRLISTAVLLLVLGTGFVLGLAWDRRPSGPLSDERASEARRNGSHGDRGGGRDGDRRRLIVDRVDLTPSQQARVDSIVGAHREDLKELQREFRSEYGPRHRELVQRTRTAIRAVLTPAQRELYDSLLARHDRKDDERRRDDDHDRGPRDGS